MEWYLTRWQVLKNWLKQEELYDTSAHVYYNEEQDFDIVAYEWYTVCITYNVGGFIGEVQYVLTTMKIIK